eukprot:COSAG01_NODE_54056_length_334_cov_8.842553_1_plen_78_part_01
MNQLREEMCSVDIEVTGDDDYMMYYQQHLCHMAFSSIHVVNEERYTLAQISVCLRFLAGARVFEAAEIQIRQQILNPC